MIEKNMDYIYIYIVVENRGDSLATQKKKKKL